MLSRSLRGSLILLVPLVTHALPSPPKAPPVTGLKILATALDAVRNVPGVGLTRDVAVTVQNVSNKTIVAYNFRYLQFDEQGKPVGDSEGYGSGIDHAGPQPDTGSFIRPGQIRTIRLFSVADPEVDTVTAEVTGLVYEDRSSEGRAAQMFFITRQTHARQAREQAARETGTRKLEFEKQAGWYEAHGPLEAQQ